jgi:hypothetical protein
LEVNLPKFTNKIFAAMSLPLPFVVLLFVMPAVLIQAHQFAMCREGLAALVDYQCQKLGKRPCPPTATFYRVGKGPLCKFKKCVVDTKLFDSLWWW